MPSTSDTAYPHVKINPTAKELNELYSPTVYELAFARERARQPIQRARLKRYVATIATLSREGSDNSTSTFAINTATFFVSFPGY